MKKVLVTGGAGFIGSNLVDKLVEAGHRVIVLDNLVTGNLDNIKKYKKKIKIVKIDIFKANENVLQKYFNKVEWVIHLAALADIVPSITNPKDYFNTNVVGTFKILEAARKSKVKKFIYAASASCYGIPNSYPTSEEEKIDKHYPYALTKNLGEELVLHWARVYRMPNVSLRFFNVYGPRSRTSGAYGAVFGVFLAQKISGKPLTVVGDGNQTRDFVHVYDLVDAILLALNKKNISGNIYNVGGGKEVKINLIAKLIGGNIVNIPKRPGEPDRSLADITKIKKSLKWKPKIDIKEGVEMLLNQISYWKTAPVWTKKKIQKVTKEWFRLLK
jgi:UDP-glucose 4-epimerase